MEKIYWTDPGFNEINRANLNGTSKENLLWGLVGPRGIAVDVVAGKMYWADYDRRIIQRSYLDGFNIETVISDPGGLYAPHHIALAVPEPATWLLFLSGFLSVLQRRRRGGGFGVRAHLDVSGWVGLEDGELQRGRIDR